MRTDYCRTGGELSRDKQIAALVRHYLLSIN